MHPDANTGAFAPTTHPVADALDALTRRRGTLRPARLDRGDLMRVVDGQGTLVHARTGVLWITDESSAHDVVLHAGQTHRIPRGGTTLIEAHRGARVVVEVPRGVRRPALVEIAFHGRPSRRIPLSGGAARGWLERMRFAIARLVEPAPWPLSDERASRDPRRRPPSSRAHDAGAYTPEAVRDRLFRAFPFPYY